VLTDHPSYPAALDAIRTAGARPAPVPLGPAGWDMELLEATLRQAAPRLAYLIADNHNPTGLSLPAADRERLVALARATRTPLVVDEAMTELDLDGDPPPPVAAHDPAGETAISLGSMSKGFWAGLRIGWIRAAPALVHRLVAARASLDLAGPVIEQLVAAELLRRADEILPARREQLRSRRDALAAALPPQWRFTTPRGGLCLWVELDAPRSTALAAIADRHGVRVAAGPRFGVDGAFERFVRLPFTLPEETLREAAARLAVAWRSVSEGLAGTSPPAALVA
jgi:DNA-binding transcriptional MocR family regulator